MATTRTSTARLTRSALAALKSPRFRSQSRPELSRAAELLVSANNFSAPPRCPTGNVVPENLHVAKAPFSNFGFGKPSARLYSSATSSGQINNSEFTEMALDAIANAIDAARTSKQQVVETEHLMKAMLEQKDGLARRIFTKSGLDNTTVLQATDEFIYRQPTIVGDYYSGPVVGSNLASLLDNAKKLKKQMGDDFLSVEHLVLAFLSDTRFGKKLFEKLQLNEKDLKDAVQAVRGNQRVTDQSNGQLL